MIIRSLYVLSMRRVLGPRSVRTRCSGRAEEALADGLNCDAKFEAGPRAIGRESRSV